MLTAWFAHAFLRCIDWQLSILEALTFRLLLRILKRMAPHQQEELLRRIGFGERSDRAALAAPLPDQPSYMRGAYIVAVMC